MPLTLPSCGQCLPHCNVTSYSVLFHQTHEDPYNGVYTLSEFAFADISFTEEIQSAAYPFQSLVGELGGQLGLCIGASLLSRGDTGSHCAPADEAIQQVQKKSNK